MFGRNGNHFIKNYTNKIEAYLYLILLWRRGKSSGRMFKGKNVFICMKMDNFFMSVGTQAHGMPGKRNYDLIKSFYLNI